MEVHIFLAFRTSRKLARASSFSQSHFELPGTLLTHTYSCHSDQLDRSLACYFMKMAEIGPNANTVHP